MAQRGPYLLGIDAGTQSLRALVVDLQGTELGCGSQAYPTAYPHVAWAEQEPRLWWEAVRVAVPQAVAQAGITARDIAGISVSGTSSTTVAVARDGKPLRPAIMWMDQRATRQADEVTATGHPCLRYAGGVESPEWNIPRAMWLRDNQPDLYEQADLLVEQVDWLTHKLTGEWTASLDIVSCKSHYVSVEGGWPTQLLAELGISELQDKWPRTVLPMGAQAGELSATAAEQLQLSSGIPVAAGGIDAHTAMLGIGVVEAGQVGTAIGSSSCLVALSAEAIFGSHWWGPFPEAMLRSLWVLEGAQAATGSVVSWLADNFGYPQESGGEDRFEALDAQAAATPAGAEGLVVLDYWQGNRVPLRDPLARGAIWGLSLRHDIGHLLRAIYEGTAMGCRHIIEDLAGAGVQTASLRACGGGTRSRLWMQIHADVLQMPLLLTRQPHAAALGTAICAATGGGLYAGVGEASQQMVRLSAEVEPNAANTRVYDAVFDRYLRTYPALASLMRESAEDGASFEDG
jgi:FGGY-family pentulose kinase